MIDISNLHKKIQEAPQDNTLYLMEKLPCGTGLFVSNRNLLYLVPNDERCESLGIKTEFLNLETNIYVSAFSSSASSFANGYYNCVELVSTESHEYEGNLGAFVNMCLAHASYMRGKGFMEFFDSLVSLFQLPREQHYMNLIGLVGELLFIEYVFNKFGIDISQYWHSEGATSQFDFVCPFAKLEIKTTSGDSLRFSIKHNQLFTETDNNYLVAVVVDETNAGRTLEDIISGLLEDKNCCNSMHFSVNIEKEKRRISPIEFKNKRFVLKKILLYRAEDINPFISIPDCVESLSYKLNLYPFKDVPLSEILR